MTDLPPDLMEPRADFLVAEVGAVGLLAGAWRLVGAVRQFEEGRKYGGVVTRTVLSLGAPLCFVAAGALLARDNPAAAYWLVAGVLVSFVAGLVGAWVLLIEILR